MSLFKNETLATPQILGYTDGTSAPAGQVGEVLSSPVAVGSAVALTTATPANVTSLSLTAGDWDVSGNVNFTAASATTAAGGLFNGGINITSATIPTTGTEVVLGVPAVTTTSFKAGFAVPPHRITVNATTTVYLVAQATFSAGTIGAYGELRARRER